MIHTYFLGANTPKGFRSEYESLHADPRIQTLRILKGGSGCGKSTLMRSVAEQAGQLGLDAELIPCSSDPDSLDGIVIPELGLAIVDGTAPHVVEPKLCGCCENYVNLGAYYKEELLRPLQPALQAAKAANAACYAPAYRALAAAAEVGRILHGIALLVPADDSLERAKAQLLSGLPCRSEKPGRCRRCFLSAVTPAGLRSFPPQCRTLWTIRDGFALAGDLIREFGEAWRRAGEDTVLAVDPMDPDTLCGVLVPARELACWRADPLFDAPRSVLWIDLEKPVRDGLPPELRVRLDRMFRLRKELCAEAVFWLAQAKAHHDILEELYRPAVDFSGVSAEADALIRDLFTEVGG